MDVEPSGNTSKRFDSAVRGGDQGENAAYVTIEHFSGELDGVEGGFSLVHRGLLKNGDDTLMITIIPGSGHGDLTDIEGQMQIRIDDGNHFYHFDYRLPRVVVKAPDAN